MKKTQITLKQNTADTDFRKTQSLKYERLILKISGEILGADNNLFRQQTFDYITRQIIDASRLGAKIGIVIGGGNIIRGREAGWLNKIDADICGMLATIINGIIIHSQLRKSNIPAKLSSGLEVGGVVDRCNKFEDLDFYDSGGVLVFVGGIGNPLFTTDTAAALRAAEFNADILVKATKVEGVYSADPEKNSKVEFYDRLTFQKAIAKKLGIMDLAAFNICRETNIPINVYNLMKYSLSRVIKGENIGTLITNGV
ncbi:MAG: UMP kinase [bacterium]